MSGIRSKSAFFEGGWVTLSTHFRAKGASPTNHCWCQKTKVIAVSCVTKISATHHLVLSQYVHLTDRQTDGWTEFRQQYRALHYMQSHGNNIELWEFFVLKLRICRLKLKAITGHSTWKNGTRSSMVATILIQNVVSYHHTKNVILCSVFATIRMDVDMSTWQWMSFLRFNTIFWLSLQMQRPECETTNVWCFVLSLPLPLPSGREPLSCPALRPY